MDFLFGALRGGVTDFLFGARHTEPVAVSRSFISTLVSWGFRLFVGWAILLVVLVILWNVLKAFLFRRVANIISPDYRDLVQRIRQYFDVQQIRDPPTQEQRANAFTGTTSTNCPICLLDPAEMPVQTNCGHLFCGNCITTYWRQGNWANEGIKCPVCRQKVTLLMRDMRAGVIVPADADRAAAIEEDIRQYNRRYSGQPRSWVEKIQDLPNILQHFTQNVTLTSALRLAFGSRIVPYVIMFLIYFVMPFDLLPESLLGVFGLVDDMAVLGLVLNQLAGFWRAVVVEERM